MTNKNEIYISVVIPCFNEIKNLQRGVLDQVYQYMKKQPYHWEIIISDDGSRDSSPQFLKKFQKKDERIRVLFNQHEGKGPTVKKGMLKAKGQYRLFTDMDQSTPINTLEKFLPLLENYQVVIASREAPGSRRTKEPFYRHLLGRGFNKIVQFLVLPGLKDTQCGFKLFSDKASRAIFNKLQVYKASDTQKAFLGAFDVEVLYIAKKQGFKIKEIGIDWQYFDTDRLNPIMDSLKMFVDILKIKFNGLLGRYQ